MPLNPKYFIPQEMKTSIIKIFTYEDKTPVGVLINPYYDKSMHFFSFIQFIMLMDEMQDSLNYPQESMETRAFTANFRFRFTPENKSVEEFKDIKPIASFKINVYFRQNASWQGNIAWLERQTEAQFRSVLELVKLMDSALSSESGPPAQRVACTPPIRG